MKTERQIEEFLGSKTLCCHCYDFKNKLCDIYEAEGLDACNKFISNYDGQICGTLDSFIHVE